MIGKRVVEEKPVTLAEVREILESQKKQEMDYAQRLSYDYAQKFAKVDAKTARKIHEELAALGKLRENHIVTIIDLMPEAEEDLELVFYKERVGLTEEDFKKILEILDKYRE
ncbi:MAG: RNA polymerase Rpb4 family protein [Candidatus Hadarchaeales archaeon]